MCLSQFLISIGSLVTLAVALPTAQSSGNVPSPWGVPSQEVVCETPKEARVHFDPLILATTITQSMSTYQGSVGRTYAPTGNRFPKIWGGNDSIGIDPNGQKYTVIWAPGCDLTATILYAPLPVEITKPILSSPDIVLFSATLVTSTAPTTGHYCAVLTNSNAAPEDQLLVNGRANEKSKGYQQCNEDLTRPGAS